MTTIFNIARDITGTPSFLLPYSDQNYYVPVSLGDQFSFTIPSDFSTWIIKFNYAAGSLIYISVNEDAVIPTETIITRGSPLNPPGFRVNKGDVINFISPTIGGEVFTFSLYGLNN